MPFKTSDDPKICTITCIDTHTYTYTHTHAHIHTDTVTHYKIKLVLAGLGLLQMKGHENVIKSRDY